MDNKERFKSDWLRMTSEPILEFPNGEYFCINYNENSDTLEYGYCNNAGFKVDGSILCDYDFSLDENIQSLQEKMEVDMPRLLCANTDDWFDSLTKRQLVDVWNLYLVNMHGETSDVTDLDTIREMSESVIDEMFPSASALIRGLGGQRFQYQDDWWHYKRNGVIESLERPEDGMSVAALQSWACTPDNYQTLIEHQNKGYDLDL